MPSRQLSTFAMALAASLSACAFSPRPEAQRKLALLHSPNTFTSAMRVEVVVIGPDGRHHDASGEIARGGTTRALCRSLLNSLASSGCVATKQDATDAADPLVRSMQQNVLLPDGWRFVSVSHRGIGDAPDTELVVMIDSVP